MLERRIFSLSDGSAILVCSVVILSLLTAFYGDELFGGRRGRPRRMVNGTQVRGIQQSFVLYSNSNNGYYPGYNSDGTNDFAAISATTTDWGTGALHDDDISKIYALMLTGEFFTSEYIISPSDDLTNALYDRQIAGTKPTIDNTMYSYALLDMNDDPSNRRDEWKDSNNSQAPIVADPSSDIRPLFYMTYHSDVFWMANSDLDYEGNIAWNDNHVTFENTGLFQSGTLKIGDAINQTALNPFKNKADDGAKFIW